MFVVRHYCFIAVMTISVQDALQPLYFMKNHA